MGRVIYEHDSRWEQRDAFGSEGYWHTHDARDNHSKCLSADAHDHVEQRADEMSR